MESKVEQVKTLVRIYDAKLYDIWVQKPDTTERMFAKEEGTQNWFIQQIDALYSPTPKAETQVVCPKPCEKRTDCLHRKPHDKSSNCASSFGCLVCIPVPQQRRDPDIFRRWLASLVSDEEICEAFGISDYDRKILMQEKKATWNSYIGSLVDECEYPLCKVKQALNDCIPVPQPEPALLLTRDEAIVAYENNNPADDHAIGVDEVAKAQLAKCQQEIDRLQGQLEVKHFNEEFEIRADEYRKAEARIKELDITYQEIEAAYLSCSNTCRDYKKQILELEKEQELLLKSQTEARQQAFKDLAAVMGHWHMQNRAFLELPKELRDEILVIQVKSAANSCEAYGMDD